MVVEREGNGEEKLPDISGNGTGSRRSHRETLALVTLADWT